MLLEDATVNRFSVLIAVMLAASFAVQPGSTGEPQPGQNSSALAHNHFTSAPKSLVSNDKAGKHAKQQKTAVPEALQKIENPEAVTSSRIHLNLCNLIGLI